MDLPPRRVVLEYGKMPRKVGLAAKKQVWTGGDGRARVRVTVSILAEEYDWVNRRGLSFSALLARTIHTLQKESPELDAEEEVRRWKAQRSNRAGTVGSLAMLPKVG